MTTIPGKINELELYTELTFIVVPEIEAWKVAGGPV
jgi:hypothetical protein